MTLNQRLCKTWCFTSILDNTAKTELIFQIMLIGTFINQLIVESTK